MMKSYVKFLSRNKLYATIEALGLSVALAFVLILVSYATAEYRVGNESETGEGTLCCRFRRLSRNDLGHSQGVLSFHPGNQGMDKIW